MANRCYLVGWDAAKGAPSKPSLDATYSVPMFWYAMFDVTDIHDVTVDAGAFVKPPGAPASFAIQTYVYCDARHASERLAQRLPRLVAATRSGPDSAEPRFAKLATRFHQFVARYAGRALLLQVSELAWMQPAGEYVLGLREQLAQIADPTVPAASLISSAGRDELVHDEYAEHLLVGWGTGLTAREKAESKQRASATRATTVATRRDKQWQSTIDACPPEGRQPYSATATFRAGDVIEHPTLGTGVVLRIIDKKKVEVQFAGAMHVLVHRPA